MLEYIISFIVLVYAGKLCIYANSVLLRKLSVKPNVCLFSSAVLSSFLPNIIDICTPSTIYMVLMEYTCMNGINKLKHYLKLILIIHQPKREDLIRVILTFQRSQQNLCRLKIVFASSLFYANICLAERSYKQPFLRIPIFTNSY